MTALFLALQQPAPIVVEVARQPEPTRDISIDTVLGMFAMAGVLMAIALLGSAVVAGVIVVYRRRRDALRPPEAGTTHTRLGI